MNDVRNSTRQKRLGAALRANLKRRKEQMRGRVQAVPDEDDTDDETGKSDPEAREKPRNGDKQPG